jgi:DNA-binding beta-propeller fold protein YncE
VQVFNAHGDFLRAWGREGSANGAFHGPEDVVVDSRGRVFVTDSGNSRVQVFTIAGQYLTQFSTMAIAPAGFDPIGLAVDIADRVFVTEMENDRLEVFLPIA